MQWKLNILVTSAFVLILENACGRDFGHRPRQLVAPDLDEKTSLHGPTRRPSGRTGRKLDCLTYLELDDACYDRVNEAHLEAVMKIHDDRSDAISEFDDEYNAVVEDANHIRNQAIEDINDEFDRVQGSIDVYGIFSPLVLYAEDIKETAIEEANDAFQQAKIDANNERQDKIDNYDSEVFNYEMQQANSAWEHQESSCWDCAYTLDDDIFDDDGTVFSFNESERLLSWMHPENSKSTIGENNINKKNVELKATTATLRKQILAKESDDSYFNDEAEFEFGRLMSSNTDIEKKPKKGDASGVTSSDAALGSAESPSSSSADATQAIIDSICECDCDDYDDYADIIEGGLTEALYEAGYYDDSGYILGYDVENCVDLFTCICRGKLLVVSKSMFTSEVDFSWSNLMTVFGATFPVVALLDLTTDAMGESDENPLEEN